MLSFLRNSKVIADWLELDYFRRRRRLPRLRRVVTWTAFLACPVLVALSFLPGRQTVYQAGPVSAAHMMFNADCGRCHQAAFATGQRLLAVDDRRPSVPDGACLACHDGPIHHEQQTQTPNCVRCHREHRGRAALARVGDPQCVDCHGALRTKDGPTRYHSAVTAFATDHPPFGQWRKQALSDPGTIRFNHKAHLELHGISPETLRRFQAPLARLEAKGCAYCHQAAPPPAAGEVNQEPDQRYMQPIRYEQHCAACHPLGARVFGAERVVDKHFQEAAARFRKQAAPHPQPNETATVVRAVLRERLLTLATENAAVLDLPAPPPEPESPVPGRHRAAPADRSQLKWANDQLKRNEELLFDVKNDGCLRCHTQQGRDPTGLPMYAPSAIPTRWFPHARFSHPSHRMLQCVACHPASASEKTSDVLMPTIDTCRACHNPRVGARSDCVECHWYHDRGRDRRLNGAGTIPELTRVLGPSP